MNNRGPRHKRSKLERQINRDVIWCVVALFLMCFMCSLGRFLVFLLIIQSPEVYKIHTVSKLVLDFKSFWAITRIPYGCQ